MSIDLTKIQSPQTPVTLIVNGSIDLLTIRSTFESTVANNLSNAGIPPDSSSISYGWFSTDFAVALVCRTTATIRTAGDIAQRASDAIASASGNPVSSATVTAIGKAGDVVTPSGPGSNASWLDKLIEALDQIGTWLKWAIGVLLIGAVIWIFVESGAAAGLKKAIA